MTIPPARTPEPDGGTLRPVHRSDTPAAPIAFTPAGVPAALFSGLVTAVILFLAGSWPGRASAEGLLAGFTILALLWLLLALIAERVERLFPRRFPPGIPDGIPASIPAGGTASAAATAPTPTTAQTPAAPLGELLRTWLCDPASTLVLAAAAGACGLAALAVAGAGSASAAHSAWLTALLVGAVTAALAWRKHSELPLLAVVLTAGLLLLHSPAGTWLAGLGRVGVLLPGAASLSAVLIVVWQHWRFRRQAWLTAPERLVEPLRMHPLVEWLILAVAVLAGLAAVAQTPGWGGAFTLIPAMAALLALGHLSLRSPAGWLGLALCAVLTMNLTGSARLAGGLLAGAHLLWLAYFWEQQLCDGRPWTTAGRLIPIARRLGLWCAGYCGAVALWNYAGASAAAATAADATATAATAAAAAVMEPATLVVETVTAPAATAAFSISWLLVVLLALLYTVQIARVGHRTDWPVIPPALALVVLVTFGLLVRQTPWPAAASLAPAAAALVLLGVYRRSRAQAPALDVVVNALVCGWLPLATFVLLPSAGWFGALAVLLALLAAAGRWTARGRRPEAAA